MGTLLEQLKELCARKEEFIFDLRARCQVHEGVVSAYRATGQTAHANLAEAMAQALAQDGILRVRRDALAREMRYESCRLFTDLGNATRFAREQGQQTVLNLYRHQEIPVELVQPPRNTAA